VRQEGRSQTAAGGRTVLVGFRRRFAPYVEEGSKTHTILGIRKRPFRVGDRCDCYVDPRQKTMRLLGRWPCVGVGNVRILIVRNFYGWFGRVWIDGEELTPDECNALAWHDGFRSTTRDEAFDEMIHYWIKLHPPPAGMRTPRYDFHGQIVLWRYSEKTAGCAARPEAARSADAGGNGEPRRRPTLDPAMAATEAAC